jgi:hypothetical protein
MSFPTVSDTATGALLLERINSRNTRITTFLGFNWRPVAGTIETIVPCSKSYFSSMWKTGIDSFHLILVEMFGCEKKRRCLLS